MKTKIILLIMAVFLPLSFITLKADDDVLQTKIPLNRVFGENYEKGNRGIIALPIDCYYAAFLSIIQTNVSDNLGEITIEVLNTTTGEYIYDTFDSAVTQQHILNITGSSGFYTITYTTESGETYLGTLELF